MSDLWAVHVQGPDDVLAMEDKPAAERRAAEINEWFERWSQRPEADPGLDPRIHAEVIAWPHSAEGHAEALAERIADDAEEAGRG
jgi:hypothetical protein